MQEMFKFAVHVVRRFTEVAEKNRKVFMEMLFWKGNKEALQITEGYSYETGWDCSTHKNLLREM